jgi:methylmalonyl-CoA mutase
VIKETQVNDEIAAHKPLLSEFEKQDSAAWLREAELSLKGKPVAKLKTKTYDNITIEPIYFEKDSEKLHFTNVMPGFFPFIRSNNIGGNKTKPYEICVDYTNSDIEATSNAISDDSKRSDFAVTIDLRSEKQNCSRLTNPYFSRMAIANLFKGIDLEKNVVYMLIDDNPLAYSALLYSYLLNLKYNPHHFRGGILYDPFSRLEKYNLFSENADDYFIDLKKMLKKAELMPQARLLSFDGCVYSSAGAAAVQELAFVLSKAVATFNSLINEGFDIAQLNRLTSIRISTDSNFFVSIAKIRAMRLLWAQIMNAFGCAENVSHSNIHAFASQINKTKYDRYNNILRNALECASAIIGGAESIHLRCHDELFGAPNEFSRRVSRNIQNVLKEECNLLEVIDPAGGSWYIETLTEEIARNAYVLFQKLEAEGGYFEAFKKNVIQNEIERTAAERRANISSRRDILVGINKYPNLGENLSEIVEINEEELNKNRLEAFNAFKQQCDENRIITALNNLKEKKEGNETFGLAVEAALAGASLEEIASALEVKFSKNQYINTLKPYRIAELFEQLRDNAERFKNETGSYPQVFLANVGSVGQYKARVDFSNDFFRTGGFQTVAGTGYSTAEAAAEAIIAANAPIAVICSSDDLYPEIVPAITQLVKKAKPELKLIVAGYPTDYIEQFKAAGVDDFIHIKSVIYDTLLKMQNEVVGGLK